MTSDAERSMSTQIRYVGLPEPESEHRFAAPRRWRFDFAWPSRKLAVEVEGGTFSCGRHTRGTGYEADLEKYNAAALLGWTVLRFTTRMVDDGSAISVIEKAMQS